MKKTLITVITVLLLGCIVYYFYPIRKTSVTTEFTVDEKTHLDKTYWITGHNPNNTPKKIVKINVKEKEVWNSFQEKKTYTITYLVKKDDITFVEFVKE